MERNYSIDVIKIIAMYGVIALHTTIYYIETDTIVSNVLFYCFVISVPLFFITSGYLLLGRKNVNYKYSLQKIFNIFKVIAFFVFCWWILTNLKSHEWNTKTLVANIIFSLFQKGVFWQFWYFGSMICIYILYPIINKLFIRNISGFIYLTVGLVLIQWIVFNFNVLSQHQFTLVVDRQEIIEFTGGVN